MFFTDMVGELLQRQKGLTQEQADAFTEVSPWLFSRFMRGVCRGPKKYRILSWIPWMRIPLYNSFYNYILRFSKHSKFTPHVAQTDLACVNSKRPACHFFRYLSAQTKTNTEVLKRKKMTVLTKTKIQYTKVSFTV